MRMPPGMINMLLEINMFPYREQCVSFNGSPFASESVSTLLRAELIETDPRIQPASETRDRTGWRTTEKGKVHIDKMCNMQLPVRTWT